jgi:hypothetical protein
MSHVLKMLACTVTQFHRWHWLTWDPLTSLYCSKKESTMNKLSFLKKKVYSTKFRKKIIRSPVVPPPCQLYIISICQLGLPLINNPFLSMRFLVIIYHLYNLCMCLRAHVPILTTFIPVCRHSTWLIN